MQISLIAAMGRNRVIGMGSKMPWHLPDELQYYMDKTLDHFVLMGRKTFLAHKKIMQDHKVIVVTRQKDFHGDYARVVSSIEEGIKLAKAVGESELFVSGGGQIYEATIQLADRLYLTIIDGAFEGDVLFPEFREEDWRLISKKHHPADKRHVFSFDYLIYDRR